MQRTPQRRFGPGVDRSPPSRRELLQVLQAEIDSTIVSFREVDGVLRDPVAVRKLLCLEAALHLVSSIPWCEITEKPKESRTCRSKRKARQ